MPSKKIDILIVEDNLSFAVELEMLLTDIGCNVIKRVDNSADALECIFSSHIDLILMDIDIKGALSGVEIAQKIKHLNLPILFITSQIKNEIYQQATESNSIGYLVKPLQTFTLRSAINLAIEQIHKKEEVKEEEEDSNSKKNLKSLLSEKYLYIKKKDMYQKVLFSDIHYFQSDNVYLIVHIEKEKFIIRQKLSSMLNLLPKQFVLIHRSYIVNINKMDGYNSKTHKVSIGGAMLEVSRSHRENLVTLLPMIK